MWHKHVLAKQRHDFYLNPFLAASSATACKILHIVSRFCQCAQSSSQPTFKWRRVSSQVVCSSYQYVPQSASAPSPSLVTPREIYCRASTLKHAKITRRCGVDKRVTRPTTTSAPFGDFITWRTLLLSRVFQPYSSPVEWHSATTVFLLFFRNCAWRRVTTLLLERTLLSFIIIIITITITSLDYLRPLSVVVCFPVPGFMFLYSFLPLIVLLKWIRSNAVVVISLH